MEGVSICDCMVYLYVGYVMDEEKRVGNRNEMCALTYGEWLSALLLVYDYFMYLLLVDTFV